MIKKIFALLSVLVLSVAVCMNVYALGDGMLTVDTVDAKVGDVVTVKIAISNNPGIIAMRLFVSYDQTKLKLLKAENGDVFDDAATQFGKDLSKSPVTVLWEDGAASADNRKNGTLAVLSFQILDNASGFAGVWLSMDNSSTFNRNINEVGFSIVNGGIKVENDAVSDTCNHSKTTWKTDKNASCVETGNKIEICESCTDTLSIISIPAIGHEIGESDNECDDCGYVQPTTKVKQKYGSSENSANGSANSDEKELSDNSKVSHPKDNTAAEKSFNYVVVIAAAVGVVLVVAVVVFVKKKSH